MAGPTYSSYKKLNKDHGAPSSRIPYAMIEGDRIGVICRTTKSWNLVQGSGKHKASETVARKNVLAIILSGYTSIKSKAVQKTNKN